MTHVGDGKQCQSVLGPKKNCTDIQLYRIWHVPSWIYPTTVGTCWGHNQVKIVKSTSDNSDCIITSCLPTKKNEGVTASVYLATVFITPAVLLLLPVLVFASYTKVNDNWTERRNDGTADGTAISKYIGRGSRRNSNKLDRMTERPMIPANQSSAFNCESTTKKSYVSNSTIWA